LLFDPNNYRLQDSPEFALADTKRIHESGVQARAYRRLLDDPTLLQLKNSILKNGYLPVETIIVSPYDNERFLVVEGNRRLAAIRWINEDYRSGVPVGEEILRSIEEIKVLVVEGGDEADGFRAALMGIRHVSGIKQWGGYQRAKLVADMKDQYQMETGEVADRLAMTAQEVNRRYRAFKALEQMIDDEDYGGNAGAAMYPIFHEALAIPIVRDWLGWNDTIKQFTNDDTLRQFYSLITPAENEDGLTSPPKIPSYTQVRELREILANTEAKRFLADSPNGFDQAMLVITRARLSRVWASEVSEAIAALKNISTAELKAMTPDEVASIAELRDMAQERLNDFEKLTS
jgi:hypothetical protein